MTTSIDHRCLPCSTLSSVAGACTFCGAPMTSLQPDAVPCPEWPERDVDGPNVEDRTVRVAARRPRRTRTKAAA